MNTLGHLLRLTSYGESHGPCVGVILDGFPSNSTLDVDWMRYQLSRRRPGQSVITTSRKEEDEVEIKSGWFEEKTTGSPLSLEIKNKDAKSSDYDHLKEVFRPSHGDFTTQHKYGHRDHRGGGRTSARITAPWVAAGSLAQSYLREHYGIEILSSVSKVYNIQVPQHYQPNRAEIDFSLVRCGHQASSEKMIKAIELAKAAGDSLGGIISTSITGLPVGVGEPIFSKLEAKIAEAMLSINATKGVSFGAGFDIVEMKGSESNDEMQYSDGSIEFITNNSGGVQAGISNGASLDFKVAFKPTSTLKKEQATVNKDMQNIQHQSNGRHDPCVVPRAVPIVETLSALVILDLILIKKANEA